MIYPRMKGSQASPVCKEGSRYVCANSTTTTKHIIELSSTMACKKTSMKVSAALLLLLLMFVNDAESSADEKSLVDYLFKRQDYNPLIRPVRNLSDVIIAGFEMALIQLITLDEKRQIMKTNIWMRMRWTDYQLQWDPEQFGGIVELRIRPERIWTPDIVLFNNADGQFEASFKCNVVLGYEGNVMWIPCAIYKSSCTVDVKYFPFDEQQCQMIYGSWTFNGNEVDLTPYISGFTKVDLTDYEKSGTWDVVAVPGEITNLYDSKEKVNVSRAVYTIVIRRKTLYYATNLILPCVLVSCLTMVAFYLPATAGEKVTFTISILLALIVFLQVLVTNLLPPSSISLPLFAKYLLFTIIIDICSILNTIISLNWNWKTPRTDSMPPWIRTFFFKYMARALMMERPGASEASQQQQQTSASDCSASSSPTMRRLTEVGKSILSETHSPHCRYTKLSVSERTREVEAEQAIQYEISNDFNKAIEAARFIAAHLKNENDYGEVIDDWQYISLLLDRLLFYIYLVITVVVTLSILMYAPHIFSTFDQQAFKKLTLDERYCWENEQADFENCMSRQS